jgi:GNAT superfamily N-acetyltransferase
LPSVYAEERDLVIAPSEGKGREQPIEGALLGARRSVEECRHLAEMAAELPPGSSALALLDGSLILWGLEAYPEFVSETLVDKGLLTHFDRIRELNRDKKLALASYISRPRATDVVNALRVAICPHEPVDCDRFCAAGEKQACPPSLLPAVPPELWQAGRDYGRRACDAVAGLQDRELFASLLEPWERSALFISQSSVVEKRYREHTVYFFYLRLDDEIARVEIPRWVARDRDLVNLTHSLVLDQCQRGQGYPVALSEAHEQAVVTTADRENFWQLVEANLVEEHLPTPTSGKNRSKRTRWV